MTALHDKVKNAQAWLDAMLTGEREDGAKLLWSDGSMGNIIAVDREGDYVGQHCALGVGEHIYAKRKSENCKTDLASEFKASGASLSEETQEALGLQSNSGLMQFDRETREKLAKNGVHLPGDNLSIPVLNDSIIGEEAKTKHSHGSAQWSRYGMRRVGEFMVGHIDKLFVPDVAKELNKRFKNTKIEKWWEKR